MPRRLRPLFLTFLSVEALKQIIAFIFNFNILIGGILYVNHELKKFLWFSHIYVNFMKTNCQNQLK